MSKTGLQALLTPEDSVLSTDQRGEEMKVIESIPKELEDAAMVDGLSASARSSSW